MVPIEVGKDLMRVGSFLASGIGARPIANALKVICHIADRTVAVDGKNLEVAAGVAGSEQIQP